MSTRIIITIALALSALSMNGCQPAAYLRLAPPKPAVGDTAAPPALTASDPQERMTLLYATTREPQGTGAWRQYGESVADELRFGCFHPQGMARARSLELRYHVPRQGDQVRRCAVQL